MLREVRKDPPLWVVGLVEAIAGRFVCRAVGRAERMVPDSELCPIVAYSPEARSENPSLPLGIYVEDGVMF